MTTTTTFDWEAALSRLEDAYAPATLRAYGSDFASFDRWCEGAGLSALPASPETVAAFVSHCARTLRANTVRRRLKGIRKVHRLLRLPNPCADEEVLIALRRAFRANGSRARQALGLTRQMKAQLLGVCDPTTLQGLRNMALVTLAYDLLCRRSELVALQIDDLVSCEDGGLTLLVRRRLCLAPHRSMRRCMASGCGHRNRSAPSRHPQWKGQVGSAQSGQRQHDLQVGRGVRRIAHSHHRRPVGALRPSGCRAGPCVRRRRSHRNHDRRALEERRDGGALHRRSAGAARRRGAYPGRRHHGIDIAASTGATRHERSV